MDILDSDEQVYQRQQRNYMLHLQQQKDAKLLDERGELKLKESKPKLLKNPHIIVSELFPISNNLQRRLKIVQANCNSLNKETTTEPALTS